MPNDLRLYYKQDPVEKLLPEVNSTVVNRGQLNRKNLSQILSGNKDTDP